MAYSAQQIILLLAVSASLLAATQAATLVVGDSENWRYGYNYTEWAANTAPFYFQDTLGNSYQPKPYIYKVHEYIILVPFFYVNDVYFYH